MVTVSKGLRKQEKNSCSVLSKGDKNDERIFYLGGAFDIKKKKKRNQPYHTAYKGAGLYRQDTHTHNKLRDRACGTAGRDLFHGRPDP